MSFFGFALATSGLAVLKRLQSSGSQKYEVLISSTTKYLMARTISFRVLGESTGSLHPDMAISDALFADSLPTATKSQIPSRQHDSKCRTGNQPSGYKKCYTPAHKGLQPFFRDLGSDCERDFPPYRNGKFFDFYVNPAFTYPGGINPLGRCGEINHLRQIAITFAAIRTVRVSPARLDFP